MKKLLVVLGILTSFSANAEQWRMLQDSADGQRLLVDLHSVNMSEYKKEDGQTSIRIAARMIFAEVGAPFISALDVKECIANNSGVIVMISGKETQARFWDARGSKMYDAQGVWLCEAAKYMLENKTSETPKSQAF